MRVVDVYTVQPWGLYMARPTPGRVQFHYLESWLLPSLGLRATVFHFNPGHHRDQDFYLDVVHIRTGPTAWHTEDHYLDLVLRTGRGVELCDVDELLTAVRHGLLTPRAPNGRSPPPCPRSTASPGTTTTSTGGSPVTA